MNGQPPAPPIPQPQSIPQSQKKAVGLATVALVLGLCSLIPGVGILLGIVAFVLGIVALAKGTSAPGRAITGIVLGGLLGTVGQALGVSILLPSLNRARELAKRQMCESSLKRIGGAIHVYAAEHDDRLPPDIETLARATGLPSRVLECPTMKDGEGIDYFYHPPADRMTDVGARSLLACDYPENHKREAIMVLRADGSVERLTEPEFRRQLGLPENMVFSDALEMAQSARGFAP